MIVDQRLTVHAHGLGRGHLHGRLARRDLGQVALMCGDQPLLVLLRRRSACSNAGKQYGSDCGDERNADAAENGHGYSSNEK